MKPKNSRDLDRRCWSLRDKVLCLTVEKTTSRSHMHKGVSQQLIEKHRGARRGRNRPEPVSPGRLAWPVPGSVRVPLWPRCLSIYCLCLADRHIHTFIREPPTRGEAPGGSRRPPQVLKFPRRWLRIDPSRHGWPYMVKPWWSSGAMPWIHQGTYTFDSDINLILSLLLIYFDACLLSFMCVSSMWP
jgi:hypothetical protein